MIDDEQESQDVMDEEEKLRLLRLREWRDTTAESLSLSSSLIWPNESLKRLAKDPNIFEDEILSSEVRQWQCNQFSSSLSSFLKAFDNTAS